MLLNLVSWMSPLQKVLALFICMCLALMLLISADRFVAFYLELVLLQIRLSFVWLNVCGWSWPFIHIVVFISLKLWRCTAELVLSQTLLVLLFLKVLLVNLVLVVRLGRQKWLLGALVGNSALRPRLLGLVLFFKFSCGSRPDPFHQIWWSLWLMSEYGIVVFTINAGSWTFGSSVWSLIVLSLTPPIWRVDNWLFDRIDALVLWVLCLLNCHRAVQFHVRCWAQVLTISYSLGWL